MTKILKFVVEGGTGQNARIPGWEVAGKTGTTQNYKEAWFVGYTPRYVMATMVYNDKGSRVQLSGGDYPARIFHKVMSEIHAGLKPKSFEGPTKKGPSIPESDGPSWNPGPEKPTPPDRARNRPIPGRNRIPAEVTTAATTLPRPPTQAVTTVKAAGTPVAAEMAAAKPAAGIPVAAEMAAAAAAKPAAEMAAETPEAAVETALGKTEEKRRGCIPARP